MAAEKTVLGIDVGSVSVAVVEIDLNGTFLGSRYAFHQGQIGETLAEVLEDTGIDRVGWLSRTSSTPPIINSATVLDTHVAEIAAARHLHPDAQGLLTLGGEKFRLTRFDEYGDYVDTRTNSSCAAGTGSFLDEQAKNLGFESSAALAEAACASRAERPKIASRCAVFAKTDLIHAQQEGNSCEAICDGLCHGLATIVADTLFSGEHPPAPLIFAGGVARNESVARHLRGLIGADLRIDDKAHLYGALGAALLLIGQIDLARSIGKPGPKVLAHADVRRLLATETSAKTFDYGPLALKLSTYPDFLGHKRYHYEPRVVTKAVPVEVDIYEVPVSGTKHEVYVGIDIGSTSTKAIVLTKDGRVLAGFYTRTSGRPLAAVQGLFEAVTQWCEADHLDLQVRGAGTTGSGRKFIGAIIGADLVVDEITAHARAAYELDPTCDTIIEIGGQDAKFTTLRDGMVTFAAMNTVCAAGTGSFVEEQARRLDCSVSEYSDRVGVACAPLASDRCTVFMQRDANHLLGSGYAIPEVLATVLHAVRENYLRRVAREASIGERVCFQGATAKNRALVAAFEQRLGKPIQVSKYCHLTGALGTAHMLASQAPEQSNFRGLSLYRDDVPLRSEVCGLCKNHCKIALADVRGETAAYGFLCGRDYDADRFVSANRSGFDLHKARKRAFRACAPVRSTQATPRQVTIGIPAALYLVDKMPLWSGFFERLGVRVITSEGYAEAVSHGKKLAKAEFCAPMAAFHGHVAYLASRADYVFVPIYLEARQRERNTRRQFCYYSQYASSLLSTFLDAGVLERCITPLVTHGVGAFQIKARLFAELRPLLGPGLGFTDVASAYNQAVASFRVGREKLKTVFKHEMASTQDIRVALLGRPYSCLSPSMNKGIPDIIAKLGVKAFFQDMIPYEKSDVEAIAPLLGRVHWAYATEILAAAEIVAKTPGLYPVLVSCFKCTPDSCTIEFFKRILDSRGKPYLILELDEHDSSVGYETRIEAAVRSFRNHQSAGSSTPRPGVPSPNPKLASTFAGKSVFIPAWDSLTLEMLVAGLRREGVDAHVLHEDERIIQRAMRKNTGQCIPLNAIAQGFVEHVERLGVDPANAVLWTLDSRISCNIGLYADTIKALLESYGRGFENAGVFLGEISFYEVSTRAAINSYFAYMFGGFLRRMACRLRPSEVHAGATDEALAAARTILTDTFADNRDKLDAITEVVDAFEAIVTRPSCRPKVAIFGDLYTRDNDVMNQGLVRFIEDHGGEVVTTPYSEYVKVIAEAYFKKWLREGEYLDVVVNGSLLATVRRLERKYLEQFARVLGPDLLYPVKPRRKPEELLATFGITPYHTGESLENILKIFHLLETEPEISLFVQANPAFCCPSLITEAMSQEIMRVTGVPVVTLTYDGTAAPKNEALIPYLKYPRRRVDLVARAAKTP